MRVRFTQTTEAGVAVTDATGTIRGIEFDEREPKEHVEASELHPRPVVVLHHIPQAVYVELDEVDGVDSLPIDLITSRPCQQHQTDGACPNSSACIFCKNLIAVTPFRNPTSWSLEILLDEAQTIAFGMLAALHPSCASGLHL